MFLGFFFIVDFVISVNYTVYTKNKNIIRYGEFKKI